MTAEPRAGSPASRGLAMPPEWVEHAATWLAWPHDPLTWVAGIEPAEAAFLEMIEALVPGERVELVVRDQAQAKRVLEHLGARGIEGQVAGARIGAEPGAGTVRLHPMGHVDAWIRDYGPTFVRDPAGTLAAIDWTFDAWGGKYETLAEDDRLAAPIAEVAGAEHVRVEAVMEGGSIDVDGRGTLLTTEQCLLNENRNPELSRDEIEQLLVDHLGIGTVLWLGQGIEGDDTDGHVDDVARFTEAGPVVLATEDDPADPNHAALSENLARLSTMTDARGRSIEVVELPMPEAVRFEGQRYPASYANFYVANEVVLLPVYDDPNDAVAAERLADLFPGRQIAPIDCRSLIVGMGACHCLTQQQPARSG